MGADVIIPTPISSNRKFHFFTILLHIEKPEEKLLEELSDGRFLYQLYGIQTHSFFSNIPFDREKKEELPFQSLIWNGLGFHDHT